jgi:hypothetical protein
MIVDEALAALERGSRRCTRRSGGHLSRVRTLRAWRLQALHSIRSKRLLMERLETVAGQDKTRLRGRDRVGLVHADREANEDGQATALGKVRVDRDDQNEDLGRELV